jgi:hypothetical protein
MRRGAIGRSCALKQQRQSAGAGSIPKINSNTTPLPTAPSFSAAYVSANRINNVTPFEVGLESRPSTRLFGGCCSPVVSSRSVAHIQAASSHLIKLDFDVNIFAINLLGFAMLVHGRTVKSAWLKQWNEIDNGQHTRRLACIRSCCIHNHHTQSIAFSVFVFLAHGLMIRT